jgi:hypothetical protein
MTEAYIKRYIQRVLVLRDRRVPKNRHVYRNRVNRDLPFFNETVQLLCDCKSVILQRLLRLNANERSVTRLAHATL